MNCNTYTIVPTQVDKNAVKYIVYTVSVHCTLYSVHSIHLYTDTVHCTITYTIVPTQVDKNAVKYIVYTVSVHCTLYSIHSIHFVAHEL